MATEKTTIVLNSLTSMSHLMNTPRTDPLVQFPQEDLMVLLVLLLSSYLDFSVCMTRTFREVCAYENIRTRHKRSHLYAEMMAKMALRRYELLLLAAGRADALLCL